MQSFFRKKVPPKFVGGRGDYALSSYLFLFLEVSTLIFAVQSMTFQVNYLITVFKVIQHVFEIFRTVLNLNCKII